MADGEPDGAQDFFFLAYRTGTVAFLNVCVGGNGFPRIDGTGGLGDDLQPAHGHVDLGGGAITRSGALRHWLKLKK